MSKENPVKLAHVALLEYDSSLPTRKRCMFVGKDVTPEEAIRQAQALTQTPGFEPLRGYVFIEGADNPATVKLECQRCDRRESRMDYSPLTER